MHRFVIRVPVYQLKDKLFKVRNLMQSSGSLFVGNDSSGSFAGSGVKGEYQVIGEDVHITITKKPFIVPYSIVESKIRNYFNAP